MKVTPGGVNTSPLQGLPAPQTESRHIALTKLESQEYVLRVPKGGKSAVWKMFLNIISVHSHKVDFVLCRYCCGLFMYKGYASGTSSLMNHGIRCLDRPNRICSSKGEDRKGFTAAMPKQEDWPDELKLMPCFSLDFFKRFKMGVLTPSPTTDNYAKPADHKRISEPETACSVKEDSNSLFSHYLSFFSNRFAANQQIVKGIFFFTFII